MAIKKNFLGSVVGNHLGYNIRKGIVKGSRVGNVKTDGTFSIYGGKNLKKDGFLTVDSALSYINDTLVK